MTVKSKVKTWNSDRKQWEVILGLRTLNEGKLAED